ncbi:uncharacterized protein Gasu_07160 [Galdieria sulphuraria]|uniref:Uncharacterized protein n=1 Tax=Galdieria sulphuraria TaxID=130081 RepID=M2XP67_GALSU|nr:uncharacterized protein Gasu_07160 [Galdieria sulphuraria]EME31967.1 hypothetical protein Gasu_07160 [Galdieria sulphuraria]|eukprot:XP_005708487.1 hypothetical protein Gasu_07160 [Galdieria sulphuraria]
MNNVPGIVANFAKRFEDDLEDAVYHKALLLGTSKLGKRALVCLQSHFFVDLLLEVCMYPQFCEEDKEGMKSVDWMRHMALEK